MALNNSASSLICLINRLQHLNRFLTSRSLIAAQGNSSVILYRNMSDESRTETEDHAKKDDSTLGVVNNTPSDKSANQQGEMLISTLKQHEQSLRSKTAVKLDNKYHKERTTINRWRIDKMQEKTPNGFLLFKQDHYERIKNENPDVKYSRDVTRLIGRMWKSLPETEKKKYVDKSIKLKGDYKNVLHNLPKETKDKILSRKIITKAEKEQRKHSLWMEQMKKETGKPELPKRRSAVLSLSLTEEETELLKQEKDLKVQFIKKSVLLTKKWTDMTEEEKYTHKERERHIYEEAKSEYISELKDWVLKVYTMKNSTEESRHTMSPKARKKDLTTPEEKLQVFEFCDIVSKPEIKNVLEYLGKPKRGRTALNLFMMENGNKEGTKLKKIKEKFDNLPGSLKESYNDKSKEDKKRYTKEMKKWMDQMKSEGLEEFVTYLTKQLRRTPEKEKITAPEQ